MAERMAAGRDRIAPAEVDENGNEKKWYQQRFYQDMTLFYMSPDRIRM